MDGGVTVRKAALQDVETIADYNMRMAMETEGKTLDKDVVRKRVETVMTASQLQTLEYIPEDERDDFE